MAGYDGFSKSNNAAFAEREGKMVASKLAAFAARRWPRLRGLTAADIESTLEPSEWHHTSSWFVAVNYFDPRDLRQRGVRGRLLKLALARKRSLSAAPVRITGCYVKWIEWSGSRKHPRADECAACDCVAEFRPGRVMVKITVPPQSQVILPDGSAGVLLGAAAFRKSITTRGFSIISRSGRRVRDIEGAINESRES